MTVAALQAELQRLGYEHLKDAAGSRLKKADLVARLKAARRPHDLLKAARDLHALERMLMR